MRYQGEITHWKDDRGFGFITPDDGGTTVFVHISAFKKGQRRPAGNDLVSYELLNDPQKGFRAQNVSFFEVFQPSVSTKWRRMLMPFMATLILTGIGIYAWQHFSSNRLNVLHQVKSIIAQSHRKLDDAVKNLTVVPRAKSMPRRLEHNTKFQCQGKRRCSEMTSCEEAIFYLENCPGVEIDGDGDGIPCESQFCGP